MSEWPSAARPPEYVALRSSPGHIYKIDKILPSGQFMLEDKMTVADSDIIAQGPDRDAVRETASPIWEAAAKEKAIANAARGKEILAQRFSKVIDLDEEESSTITKAIPGIFAIFKGEEGKNRIKNLTSRSRIGTKLREIARQYKSKGFLINDTFSKGAQTLAVRKSIDEWCELPLEAFIEAAGKVAAEPAGGAGGPPAGGRRKTRNRKNKNRKSRRSRN